MPGKAHLHECYVKGKPTALELLKVTTSVSSKPGTNHPRKLCLLSTQVVPSPSRSFKKDVTLRCSPWALEQMWGCWNGLSKLNPVPLKHFVPSITWTQLINAFVQLGDLQLPLAICNTLLCCSKQEWCPWSLTLPPGLSTPQLQGSSAVTQWVWGGFSHPSTAPLGPGPGCAELPWNTVGVFSSAWLSCGLPWGGLTPMCSAPCLLYSVLSKQDAQAGCEQTCTRCGCSHTSSEPHALYQLLLWSSTTTSILFPIFFFFPLINKNKQTSKNN